MLDKNTADQNNRDEAYRIQCKNVIERASYYNTHTGFVNSCRKYFETHNTLTPKQFESLTRAGRHYTWARKPKKVVGEVK